MAVTVSITSNISGSTLNAEDLPQNVELTAVGTDSTDPGALFTYSWFLIDLPTSSVAALSDTTGETINLDIDLWGTYRVFCIAQNTVSSETSATNPVSAPLNSFFDIRVLSEKYDLEKPAKSQRNWHPQYWKLVDTVENITTDSATFALAGKSEIATANEIAIHADKTNSTSGSDFLVVSADQLYTSLEPLAGGTLSDAGDNLLRERIKDISFEKLQASSVGDLSDFSITGIQDGDMVTWNDTAGEFQPVDPQTLLVALEPDEYFSDDIFLNQANESASATLSTGVTAVNIKKNDDTTFQIGYDHDNDKLLIRNSSELFSVTETGVVRFNDAYSFPSTAGTQGQILKVDSSGNFVYAADDGGVDGLSTNSSDTLTLVSGYKFIPAVSGQDLGSTSKRFEIFGTSGDFTGNVDIDGLAKFSPEDKITSPSEGTLQIGSTGAGGSGNGLTQLVSDTTELLASHADTPVLKFTNSFSSSVSIDAPQKALSSYTYTLPETMGSDGSFMKVDVTGATTAQLVPSLVTQKVVYTTHVSRELSLEGQFDVSGNLVFAGDEQAAIYWIKNTLDDDLQLDNTFIHIGEMRNISLTFSLIAAASDSAVINNTWTQVGSDFTLVNSSGADNVVGQALGTVTTKRVFSPGEYIGIVCTDIPAVNRDDRRIVIQFECNYQL